MFQQWKDKIGRGFFNLLLTKFDQTLQLLLDNYLGEFFINKLKVQDLVKGTQNVRFNTDQLNRLLGTKALESAVIGSIKLEQMSLQILNTIIVFHLELISQEDIQGLLQNSTSFDDVKQRFLQSKEELRREMFGQQNIEESQRIPSSPLKSSNKRVESNTIKYLRIFDTLCGNSSIKITNLTITLHWEDSQKRQREINLLFKNADIILKKYPESDSMYVKIDCPYIQITTGDSTIAKMEQAIQCEIYLCENNAPKIKIDLGLLNIILNQFEFQCIKDLFEIHQKNQNLWKLCESVEIQRSIQQSQTLTSHINYSYLKNTLKVISEEQESKELKESTILIQSVRITPLEEFYFEALPLIKQKDSIFISLKGVSAAIGLNALGMKDFKELQYNISLEEHFAIKISTILFRKDTVKTHFEIQELQIYQFIPMEQEFQSLHSQNDDFFDCQIEDNIYIIRQILQIGGQIKQNGKYQKQSFYFEYPNNMIVDSPAITVIQTDQINFKISPIYITLNSNQIQFIQTLIPKSTNAPNNQVEPIVINFQFSLQPTQISCNYLLNPQRTIENMNTFTPKYCQLKIINFWIQTPTNSNNQIHFKCENIQLDQSLDIRSIAGAIEFPDKILELKDRNITFPISQYVTRLKEYMRTQISIQVQKINIQLDDFLHYHDLVKEVLTIIQQQQQQQQQSQCKQELKQEKQVKKIKNTVFFKIKLNEINITYLQLILIHLNFLKFFQTIDYRIITLKNIQIIDQKFVLPKLRQDDYNKEEKNVLIESNHMREKFLIILISQQDVRSEINQVKIKVGDLSFSTILKVLEDFKQLLQAEKNEDFLQVKGPSEVEQFQYLIEIKNSSIEIHPYHNEKIKLKKTNSCKTQVDETNYFCENKTQLNIDQITIKKNQIIVDAVHVYFLYEQNNYELNKIAIIQSIILSQNFQNIYIFKTTIQQISAKLINDIIDHSYYITENLPKPKLQQQLQQQTKQQKMQKIVFGDSNMCIGIQEISVKGNIFQLDIMNSQLKLGNQSISASIDRVMILDLLKQSRYKYVFDQDTESDYYADEISTNNFQQNNKNPFLQIVAFFNFNSLNAWVDLKPIRLCLSGVFLEALLTLLNTGKTVMSQQQSDDEDVFEIVEFKKQFNLQLQIQPIIAIISFDSNGIKLDGMLKGLISLGSLNNLILATQYMDFYAFDKDATGQFIKAFLTSFGSTFQLTLKAYNSLEIFNAFNSLSQGVTNLFTKPFYNQKGIVYGTAEGCKDLVCGFASSILNLAQLPTKVLNRFAEAIGMSIVTKPLVLLNGVCQKLYEKINPDDEVPPRFLK